MADEPTHYTPHAARQFATEVVAQLRAAGFEALWAGGCVRDQLLGHTPKDYDVATNARPEQIRDLLGHRRTLPIGASFGVITVIGTKASGQLDVATFRRDAGYSDGRRPDSVTFSSAEEDAQRRDFTINGLFFDPLTNQVIDYVGGQEDLRRGIVRAIRDPYERFREDKLRMLRAVRFTACFNFTLDPPTLAAMRDEAHAITIVSGERIAAEMRRMLVHHQRAKAVELLAEAHLLVEILPEARSLSTNRAAWHETLTILEKLDQPSFSAALAVLLRTLTAEQEHSELCETVGTRWRLSREETVRADWLLAHERLIRQATQLPWPKLQRILIQEGAEDLLRYAQAVATVVDGNTTEIDHCWRLLAQPRELLNPAPLLNGSDLRRLGWSPGPLFKRVLEDVRDAQLLKQISTHEEALALAERLKAAQP